MKDRFVTCGLLLLILLAVASSGCIKTTQSLLNSGNTDIEDETIGGYDPAFSDNTRIPDVQVTPDASQTITPTGTFVVDEVSAYPYMTPDPYRLPYREMPNFSAQKPLRVTKIPQYEKSFVLRSNSTAVRFNATDVPIVIDMTFKPLWDNPDHTGGTRGESDDEGVQSTGVSVNSFVFPSAVISVYPEGSTAAVAREGFGKEYSADSEKSMTLYREGSYVITLYGEFIDIELDITMGEGKDKPVAASQTSSLQSPDDEEEWG